MKKAALLLSGCGNRDGSEIHESVSAIIALDSFGWEIVHTAPDIPQKRTVSYITGKAIESRNSFQEAARIARGSIRPLNSALADEVDAVVIPGGLGAALTLCDFAEKGSRCTADPTVHDFLTRAHRRGIPIAAMCIAPVLVARCIPGSTVTIGTDRGTASLIEEMGCFHFPCSAEEAFVDRMNRIITTPGYMNAAGPAQVYKGSMRMIEELNRMVSPS